MKPHAEAPYYVPFHFPQSLGLNQENFPQFFQPYMLTSTLGPLHLFPTQPSPSTHL